MLKKISSLGMLIIILSSMLIMCGKVADPIAISKEEIKSIQTTNGNNIISEYTNKEEIDKVLGVLNQAKATRQQSVQDTPNLEGYYVIKITYTEGNEKTMYLYEKDEKIFIELPYEGIYKVNKDILNLLEAE